MSDPLTELFTPEQRTVLQQTIENCFSLLTLSEGVSHTAKISSAKYTGSLPDAEVFSGVAKRQICQTVYNQEDFLGKESLETVSVQTEGLYTLLVYEMKDTVEARSDWKNLLQSKTSTGVNKTGPLINITENTLPSSIRSVEFSSELYNLLPQLRRRVWGPLFLHFMLLSIYQIFEQLETRVAEPRTLKREARNVLQWYTYYHRFAARVYT